MTDSLKESYEAFEAWEDAWMLAHPDDTHTVYELIDIYYVECKAQHEKEVTIEP